MKSRIATTILTMVVSGFLSLNFLPLSKAESKAHQVTQSTAGLRSSDNLPKTVTLTEAQKAIPDEIAFEVFLRTVGSNNARQLLLQAGYDEDKDLGKIDQIMSNARSLTDSLETFDKRAREIRFGKDGGRSLSAGTKAAKELDSLQSEKMRLVQHTISYNLRTAEDSDNGWRNLLNYVKTTVKGQMRVVQTKSIQLSQRQKAKRMDTPFFTRFSAEMRAQTQVGNAYLYGTAWNDEYNVYGAGTVSEQYYSGASYSISTSVSSPSARSNTGSSDWGYATLDNTTGLSFGPEDGQYEIQSDFNQADGYYDEYGNFITTGSSYLGSISTSFVLAPTITIGSVSATPSSIQAGQTSNVKVTVSATTDVTPNTVMRIEFSPTGGAIQYSLNTPTSTQAGSGGGITVVSNRVVDVAIPNPAPNLERSVTINFPVSIDSGNTTSGTITSIFTHNNPVPNVTVQPTGPLTGPPITVTVPTGSGGGGGGCQTSYSGLGCIGCANYGAYGYTNNGCPPPFFNHYGTCCQGSPIVLDIDGNGFAMTNGANGVNFDLNGDGGMDRTSWTAASSDDAWLVLDRNQNHRVDDGKEMFGNYCDQPAPPPGVLRNGFIGLAEFDKAANGGNGDGKITRSDTVFRKLRLWQDRNHNGISEPEEMSKLPALDVVALFLNYAESNRTDQYGNRFKYRARIRDRNGARVGRWAWDVFTVPAQ